MKKYHGKSLASFVPDILPGVRPTLTAAQFAELDLWTVPRRLRIIITDVPAIGSITLIRTSSALRYNWAAAGLPLPATQINLRRVAEAALYGAAAVLTKIGLKVAGYRSTRFIVFWQPLCRSGRDAMELLHAEFAALLMAAQKLGMECGTFLESRIKTPIR